MLDKKTIDRKIADRKRRKLKRLSKELNQVYFVLKLTINPVEIETLLQRATQLRKEIDKLKSEIKMLEVIRVDK